MSTTLFVVHPAINCLPREARRVAFQTVLANFDLMKIIMELYEFYSNNTLSQLVLLWQNLNLSRLVLGDLPGECSNYNLSHAASDATRLIVLDLLYDHNFADLIDRLSPSSVQYFLYPLVFSLSPTDMEYYFQHEDGAVERFLTQPYYPPTFTAPTPVPRPTPPTLQISCATSPTPPPTSSTLPPFEEPETPATARPNNFPISLPSPIVPAVAWGEPPNWANEDWDELSNKENVPPPPDSQPIRRVRTTGKLKRKRIPVFTFGDVLQRKPNSPPPPSPSIDTTPQPDTPSSSSSSLQCLALKKCFKCKKVGHLRLDCDTYSCPSCGELAPGHTRDNCPHLLYCIHCHNRGHREEDCSAHDWDNMDLTDYVINEGDYEF